jgi:hypothetical protein
MSRTTTERPTLPNATDPRLIVRLNPESPLQRTLWGLCVLLGSALIGLLFWMAAR